MIFYLKEDHTKILFINSYYYSKKVYWCVKRCSLSMAWLQLLYQCCHLQRINPTYEPCLKMIKRQLSIRNCYTIPIQHGSFIFFRSSTIFFIFIFLKFFFLHTMRIKFFIPSCIPFLSILTYALPMDGIGFLSNSDSYVILDNAFPCQGVKNIHLIIFIVSSSSHLVAM